MEFLQQPEWRIAVAFAVGLIIGVDRERRAPHRAAGVRTFALTALLGGILGYLDKLALVVVGGVFIGAAALMGYAFEGQRDRGLTSEVALVVTYALGVLAIAAPTMALGVGIVVAATLAFRTRIHRIVRQKLTTAELLDGLTFAVAAVVVWPLLPDRAMGPFGALNPHTLWRLVVLVMGVSGIGYVAQRIVGPRLGLTLGGLASGFVSSAATVHALGQRARHEAALVPAAAAGAAASTVSTFVQMAILVGAASISLLRQVALPLVCGGAVALVYAGLLALRAAHGSPHEHKRGRAFSLRAGVLFAGLLGAVVLLARACEHWLGEAGIYVAAAVGGLADAHAAGSSVATIHAGGSLGTRAAGLAILLAITTNTITKVVLAFSAGPRPYALRVVLGLFAAVGAAWVAFFFVW